MVSASDIVAPSVSEIARRLSKILRFNGDTIRPWTVLQHVLAGLVDFDPKDPVSRLQWLFHDAEEVFTGDTPMPYKTAVQAKYGSRIREEIFHQTLRIPMSPHGIVWEHTDRMLCRAEAMVLLHPVRRLKHDPLDPDHRLVDRVWTLLDLTPQEAIWQFEDEVDRLFQNPKVKSLREKG
jgi:hypothetical protein